MGRSRLSGPPHTRAAEGALIAVLALLLAGCAPNAESPSETIGMQDLARSKAAESTRTGTAAYDPSVRDGADAPYVTTPTALIDSMLVLAGVTATDVVYDLGSGDGRIPIRAADAFGARGVGIEIRGDLVQEARQRARVADVSDRVTFHQGDLFDADLAGATVVTLYLLPAVNRALRPKLLRELRPGTRVVSRNFAMGTWAPDRQVEVRGNTLYLWRIPDDPSARLGETE